MRFWHRLQHWGLSPIAAFLLALPADATIYNVHQDRPCPGMGTEAQPFCSLRQGFAAVRCGDELRIFAAATPYTEQIVVTQPSCPADAPILVSLAGAGEAVWSGPATPANDGALLTLRDVDHWHLRGLVFRGHPQGPRSAVSLQAVTRSISGNRLYGGRIEQWDVERTRSNASAIRIAGNSASGFVVRQTQIQGVRIDGFRGRGIDLAHSVQGTYEDLEIRGGRCAPVRQPDGRVLGELIGLDVGSSTSLSQAPAYGDVFRRLRLHDFQNVPDCQAETGAYETYVHAFWCDVYASDGVVEDSQVWQIAAGSTRAWGHGVGLRFEARCHRWQVRDNTIWDVGNDGIKVNGPNNDVVIEHNTVERPGGVCYALDASTVDRPALRRVLRDNTCVAPGGAPLRWDQRTSSGDLVHGNSWQVAP